jgi:hypothetical protein
VPVIHTTMVAIGKKVHNKLFKRDKLQLAGSAPLHILANYNLPLNRALGIQLNFGVILSTVIYEITSKEVRDSYWYMLKTSAEYRKSVLKPSVVFLALPMIIEFSFNKYITSSSISLGVILSLCYPLFLVYMARAIAKKGTKSISVSSNGMDVSIGDKSKLIDWKQVAGISESVKYLFVLSNGGNFMCIPKRAFSNESVLTEFKTVVQKNA